jgi:periplasmic protein TonB
MTSLFTERACSFPRQNGDIPAEPGVYRPGDPGLTMPVCEYCPIPQDTDLSRKAKYQGSVKLSVLIGVDGRLGSITVLKEAPFNLTTAAVEAAETWRLKPGKKDGQPVPVRVPIEIMFRWY